MNRKIIESGRHQEKITMVFVNVGNNTRLKYQNRLDQKHIK